MPGLVKAGAARITVIAVEDPGFRTSRPDDVSQIGQMVMLLRSMINVIKETVDEAHFVTEKSHEIHTGRVVIDGYAHLEHVTEPDGNVDHELEFFHTSGFPPSPDDPQAAKARSAAENARKQGIANELAFMGIPEFETILENWMMLVENPLSR